MRRLLFVFLLLLVLGPSASAAQFSGLSRPFFRMHDLRRLEVSFFARRGAEQIRACVGTACAPVRCRPISRHWQLCLRSDIYQGPDRVSIAARARWRGRGGRQQIIIDTRRPSAPFGFVAGGRYGDPRPGQRKLDVAALVAPVVRVDKLCIENQCRRPRCLIRAGEAYRNCSRSIYAPLQPGRAKLTLRGSLDGKVLVHSNTVTVKPYGPYCEQDPRRCRPKLQGLRPQPRPGSPSSVPPLAWLGLGLGSLVGLGLAIMLWHRGAPAREARRQQVAQAADAERRLERQRQRERERAERPAAQTDARRAFSRRRRKR